MSYFGLILNAPLVGATRIRAGAVLHAVDAEGIRFHRKTADARCGARVKLIPSARAGEDPAGPVLWPPRVKSLRNGATLCPDCRKRSERPRDTEPYIEIRFGGEPL